MPKVDVIVALFKNAQFMRAFFEAAAEQDYSRADWRILAVDNGPGDGTLEEVKRLQKELADRLPEIVVLEPGKNLGFTGGNNLAMRQALEQGRDYVYLLNGDAAFEPGALTQAVAAAESDPTIGAVQSLLVLQQNPDEINSSGNCLHYLGFGYSEGYHRSRATAPSTLSTIAYPSGAGVLIRASVLKKVGLFEEPFIAYHEDLDLGWRIWLAGYRCVLEPKSVVRHHYEFSRSITKWYWMERNRWLVLAMNFKFLTLLWLIPQILASELALLAFALVKGWWRDKFKVYAYFLKPETWRYIGRRRAAVREFRRCNDRDILALTVPTIAYQEMESWPVKFILNPVGRLLRRLTLAVVIW